MTRPAPAPAPLPATGGSYLRDPDGTLTRLEDAGADAATDPASGAVEQTGTVPAPASKKKG